MKIPEGWKKVSFEKANIKIIDGDRGHQYPSSSDFMEHGHCLFLNTKNVTKTGFNFKKVQFITEKKHSKMRKGTVNKGNIVLTTRGTVGNFAYFDDSVPYEVMRINSGMVVLDSDCSEMDVIYLYVACNSFLIKKQIKNAAFGSAQPQLTVKIIKKFKVPVPPIQEQKKIAKILTTWDEAIASTEQLLTNSQQQKKSLMQQLLTGKGWEQQTFEEANINIIDGDRGQHYPSSKDFVKNGHCLFLNTKNVTQTGFNFEKFQCITKEKHLKLRKGIVNRGNIVLTTRGTVGNFAYFDDSIPYEVIRINSGMVVLDSDCSEVDAMFLYKVCGSFLMKKQIKNSAFGSAQPQLTVKIIKSIKIPIPPIQEQQKIATTLTTADQEIETLQQQLNSLKQEKKALMQQLLTGKRRVKLDEAA